MSWLQIIHETTYRYKKAVRFGPHRLVLRPREGHDVRIEQIRVEIEPEFELPLQRCGEGERMDQHDNRPARRL